MGRTQVRADFSGALSAIVVIALIMATTAVMLVTLNSKAGAVAGLEPLPVAAEHFAAGIRTGAVIAVASDLR